MIKRGQNEGLLLMRSDEEIAQVLPSCFGYRVADEHLAGICSLLTEPYHREHAGELTALYTLTRFQGEGVGAELVREVLNEARRASCVTCLPAPARNMRRAFSSGLSSAGWVQRMSRRRNGATTTANASSACPSSG